MATYTVHLHHAGGYTRIHAARAASAHEAELNVRARYLPQEIDSVEVLPPFK